MPGIHPARQLRRNVHPQASLRFAFPLQGASALGSGPARAEVTTAFAWRFATRGDLPRIVEIYNGTIASRAVTADLDPVSVDSRVAWFEAHSPAHRPLWVAEIGGGIGGWLSFSSFYGRPAYEHTAEISIYLDAAHRRRGLGGFLLDQAIAHAPSLGLNVLLAFVFAHNRASVALFQGRAFESWGLLPRVALLDGVARDLAILGRRV